MLGAGQRSAGGSGSLTVNRIVPPRPCRSIEAATAWPNRNPPKVLISQFWRKSFGVVSIRETYPGLAPTLYTATSIGP